MEKKNKKVVPIFILIIIVLLILCIIFFIKMISYGKYANNLEKEYKYILDPTITNELYQIIGINWEDENKGSCINHLLSISNYKESSNKIFYLYAQNNNMNTERYNNTSCTKLCKEDLSDKDSYSILKIDAEKIIKVYNLDNVSLKDLNNFNNDYVYNSNLSDKECHYSITHSTTSKYIDENNILITDIQVETDYVYGNSSKINNTTNQTVEYTFTRNNKGDFYLNSIKVEKEEVK